MEMVAATGAATAAAAKEEAARLVAAAAATVATVAVEARAARAAGRSNARYPLHTPTRAPNLGQRTPAVAAATVQEVSADWEEGTGVEAETAAESGPHRARGRTMRTRGRVRWFQGRRIWRGAAT